MKDKIGIEHNSNRNSLNHCQWCGAPTLMEQLQMPDTPILEFMEDKINELGRDRVWGEDSNWAVLDLDSDTEAELLVYDEMLSNISLKYVCEKCLSEDDRLWMKYYDTGNDFEIRFDADF